MNEKPVDLLKMAKAQNSDLTSLINFLNQHKIPYVLDGHAFKANTHSIPLDKLDAYRRSLPENGKEQRWVLEEWRRRILLALERAESAIELEVLHERPSCFEYPALVSKAIVQKWARLAAPFFIKASTLAELCNRFHCSIVHSAAKTQIKTGETAFHYEWPEYPLIQQANDRWYEQTCDALREAETLEALQKLLQVCHCDLQKDILRKMHGLFYTEINVCESIEQANHLSQFAHSDWERYTARQKAEQIAEATLAQADTAPKVNALMRQPKYRLLIGNQMMVKLASFYTT